MTNKLMCPFCGAELSPAKDSFGNDLYRIFFCKNNRCEYFGCKAHAEIWQALIDGKKAQDELKGIGKILLLDSGKPSVLTVKGKQEIKRRITSNKTGA